jgi:hypothetical protein
MSIVKHSSYEKPRASSGLDVFKVKANYFIVHELSTHATDISTTVGRH